MEGPMKFAPVCPIHIYRGLAAHGSSAIGDYFLLLAHDVLENDKAYHKFFVEDWNRDLFGEPTIIMDNSVIELGTACDAKHLRQACEVVNATVVAMPDALENGIGTLARTEKFIEEWVGFANSAKYQTMYIPQGYSIADFSKNFELALERFSNYIQWLGIARNLTDRVFPTRKIAVGYLHTLHPAAKLHMLGFSDNIKDDIETCLDLAHIIEGIDSAVPLRLGTQGTGIVCDTTGNFLNPGLRGNWWADVRYTPRISQNVIDMRHILEKEVDHAFR